jgi:uncharacterized protein
LAGRTAASKRIYPSELPVIASTGKFADKRLVLAELILTGLIGCISLLYATAGQAGGTAFLAVMSFSGLPAAEMRPSALLLNVIAAGYATLWLHRRGAIEWKLLLPILVPSLVTAFLGGLLLLRGDVYFTLTGILLIIAALLLAVRRHSDHLNSRPISHGLAALVGAAAGLVSGLTGVGGGVYLVPTIITLGWASPKRAAALSPPFIFGNSVFGLIGVSLSGQHPAPPVLLYAVGALGGAAIGTVIGQRWMSQQVTRYTLAGILLFAGIRLVLR